MEKDILFQRALSCKKVHELKPDADELQQETWRAYRWSREAPMTASKLFVEAGEESKKFREVFVQRGDWREVMQQTTPDKYEKIMDLNLSIVQGSQAEKHARNLLTED